MIVLINFPSTRTKRSNEQRGTTNGTLACRQSMMTATGTVHNDWNAPGKNSTHYKIRVCVFSFLISLHFIMRI